MRRALAAVAACAAFVLAVVVPARPGAAASGAGPTRAELLERIAALTDQVDDAAAAVVGAEAAVDRLEGEVSDVRARLRARAVAAYVHGTGLDSEAELAAPAVYLEVTARKERALLARFRGSLDAAEARRAEADKARSAAAAASAELEAARTELAAVIARDAARQKALQQAADAAAAAEARRRALAAASAAAAAAAAGAAGVRPDGGSAAGGLLPRHIEATRRQAALMTRLPFGVLPPGPLPASLGPVVSTFSGNASWYGGEFNGRPTASGAIYDEDLWTVASRTLPLGSLVVVSRGDVRVLLLVNDRGPYVDGRVLDLSAAAARALDVGVSAVEVSVFARPAL